MRISNLNACRKCPDDIHCCKFKGKDGFTSLTLRDAKKIKIVAKKDFNYFLDDSPLSYKTIKSLKSCDPSLEGGLRYSQLTKDKRILRLKTKSGGNCIFLDEKGKCEIYDIRPNICRIYPYWAIRLNNGKLKVINHSTDSGCSLRNNENVDEILVKKIFRKIEREKNELINTSN